ncbi:MAG: hypothetical protein ACOC4L_03770 [Halanaerobium sp.]
MKEIPFLSAKEINDIRNYERFYHTRAYLRKKSGRLTFFKDEKDQIEQLAENSGYKKFNKFIEHRKEWHQMKRKIPRKYIKAIGAKIRVLKFTVELDREEYEKVLQIPLYPEYATVRYHPGFYKSYKFPPETTEEEAVEIMKEYAQKEDKLCFINYPGIKTVGFKPDGDVYRIYNRPDIDVTKEYIIPADGGERIGKVFLE